MELSLEFTAEDLAYTRFAVSPLWETIASLRVLKFPHEHTLHRPWTDTVLPRLSGLDLRPLTDLIRPGLIAAFICPPPISPAPDLDLELATLRSQPADRVTADLDAFGLNYPDLATELTRLSDLIQAYWDLALAPYWPRIRALLDGDVLYRARLIASGGARTLFADLDPHIALEDDTLRVRRRRTPASKPRLNNRGLLLVPSAFAYPRVFSLTSPGWQPLLRYPVRSIGTLWHRPTNTPSKALAKVLGPTRAMLLTLLAQPATTASLAAFTNLTPGAVSQHLTAMRDCGLVTAHRTGREVFYAQTTIARSLTGV
ncbi:DUF5937 family protein [Streptosporangium sp. NPDC051022]|uniref:ArsR/SmtB family transcription factor n=1 Tax=Streptosporangium sp. NPDC051022 TaxID=3155752 RepID=UPI00343491ED